MPAPSFGGASSGEWKADAIDATASAHAKNNPTARRIVLFTFSALGRPGGLPAELGSNRNARSRVRRGYL
jgi:hypothetical protein